MLHFIFNSLFAQKEFATKEIVVMRGETLWSIASGMLDENNPNIDHIIYDIQEINNMSNSDIYVGQTILVPIY